MRLITHRQLNQHLNPLTYDNGTGFKVILNRQFERPSFRPFKGVKPSAEYQAMILELDTIRGYTLNQALDIIAMHRSRIDAEYTHGD